MKTFVAKPADVERKWFVIDAQGVVLGRLATAAAHRLRGKHKPTFTPHVDTGDNIVVINAEKIRLTGAKLDDKVYYRHTGYPGGLKSNTAKERLTGKFPQRVVEDAIRGMLPKTPLGRKMIKKLKVYAGPEHPHQAQNPEALKL